MRGLTERYQIISELGRGGMGVVYKAKDASLGRTVALKRVLSRTNNALIKRFMSEAKSIAALNHPNIIQIFDIGEDAEGLFITTEFVEGTDLARLIKSKGALSPRAALKIIMPICEAMLYAHKQGIIHRDLKPANILLTREGNPKIADFGLARHESMKEMELTGMVMGTQNYASPEQFTDAKHVDMRADIYSIGAMLFEILTGTSPRFFREQAVPPSFIPIVVKAMEADRQRRYQRLDLMIADLSTVWRSPQKEAADLPTRPLAAELPGQKAPVVASIPAEDMVLVPAGPFLFGPEHRKVNLPAFFIDIYPVTNEKYALVFPAHTYPSEEANHPVTKVTWVDADAYARKVGKRLPTEAEWEKAARGTDGRRYPWGNAFSPELCNCFDAGNGRTTPVNAYPGGKSPFGAFDMAGNVWEWTTTRHEKATNFRVLKGGAYDGQSKFALCFERFAHHPGGLFQASGFRCVRSA
jgi:formylglycine-generating enzyme required for sulfatase activity/tRNA A-37 threonylcarbamoyl transferase component Bud32